MRHYTANIEFSDGGGDAAAMGRPTRDEFGAFLFSIELAGRYEGVKLQIVAIDKFGKEMIQKSLMLVAGPLSLAFFCASPLAANGLIGSAAPYFRVQSGDDKELSLDMIKGKVVAIFYENKDIVDANKRLKDELNKLYFEQTNVVKDVLVRLPVIDCSDAFWPFRGLWKQKLREHSKKEGIAIYCDWEGKMSSDYKMKAEVSNIVIIDKGGRVRFFTAGEVKAEEINDVKELLRALARE